MDLRLRLLRVRRTERSFSLSRAFMRINVYLDRDDKQVFRPRMMRGT